MDAYVRAIARAVRPGDVVVDLGSGPGILTLLALRAGARLVHAIDINPAVWLAADLANENGFGGKVVVHQQSSFDIELPEKADVILADVRGSSPLFDENVAMLEDAKRRWLKPAGVLLPARDRMFVALLEAEAHRREIELAWTCFERQGFKAASAKSAALNTTHFEAAGSPILRNQVLTDAKVWSELRYGEPFDRALQGEVELQATRGGTAHALCVWFEATLVDGISFENTPGNQLIYNRLVLPLLEPIRVEIDEAVRITLRTDVAGSQWAWETEVGSRGRTRQATFLGMPTSPEALLREATGATPARSTRGDRANQALTLMDGAHSLHQIADALSASDADTSGSGDPRQLESRRARMLAEVKSLARRYSR